MHFRDLIDSGNFSAKQEIDCIIRLINQEDRSFHSIGRLIDANFIKFLKVGPFTSLKSLIDYIKAQSSNDEESLILICEMLLYVICTYQQSIRGISRTIPGARIYEIEKNMDYLKKHIKEMVDRIHHQIVQKDDDYDFIIVPQDKKSIQAAEIVACTDKDIAIKILEYKHFSTTVDDKERILISIAKYMEDKKVEITDSLKEDDLYMQKNNKIVLVDQMFEMFNTLHIRHKNNNQYIEESQREKWYDNTYNTVLTVIIIDEQAKINKEFKELKKQIEKTKINNMYFINYF